MASRYKIYDGLPSQEELLGGQSSTLDLAFARLVEMEHHAVAQTYNVINKVFYNTHDEREVMIPVAVRLIEAGTMFGTRDQRTSECVSPSFQVQLARQVKHFFPEIRGRAI
jgi:hypothetical protein